MTPHVYFLSHDPTYVLPVTMSLYLEHPERPVRGAKVNVLRYVMAELSRGYVEEGERSMFTEKQRRVNTFMKTPVELEKVGLERWGVQDFRRGGG